jgi:hypothetical protein
MLGRDSNRCNSEQNSRPLPQQESGRLQEAILSNVMFWASPNSEIRNSRITCQMQHVPVNIFQLIDRKTIVGLS